MSAVRHLPYVTPVVRALRWGPVLAGVAGGFPAPAAENVFLTGVPDYSWHAGCFGTATGNLMGYWDRHGFPDFYTGPTGGGLAPLNSFGANVGIRSLWASQAGLDGRPFDQPGHTDDYYVDYESLAADPYVTLGRPEHTPDCLGDFIGLSQRKWDDLGGECSGNIDAYAFNFFDPQGQRRVNVTPTDGAGQPIPDIQSGLRAWTEWRGFRADTFSQLTDFNPIKPTSVGFTFADLRAEIDAGYPVLLFMQAFGQFSRPIGAHTGVNPVIHALLAYGYYVDDDGTEYARFRTSWASGDNRFAPWTADTWLPGDALDLPLRGVIGYRPHPRLTGITPIPGGWRLTWHGPLAVRRDAVLDAETVVHAYVVEATPSLDPPRWEPVAGPVTELSAEVPDCCDGPRFFRVRLTAAP